MYFYTCLCCAILICSARSGTLPVTSNAENRTLDGSKTDLPNKTKPILASEGGTLFPNSLPKQQLNSLITLDEELSKTKEKAVVPRKGVDNMLHDSTIEQKTSSLTESNKIGNLKPTTSTTKSAVATSNKSTVKDVSVLPNFQASTSKPNSIVEHKKPRKLSYEALVNWEKQIHGDQSKIPAVPSMETVATNQISSPNKDSIVKVYPTKANNSHPGMIMPIVITILVVPMFAIVGYMALKRGQEAWKNRHYKRMDFLLDGMYND